jgi:hypothetical protein
MAHCSQYSAVSAWYLSDPLMPGTKPLYHRTGWNGSQGVHTAHSSNYAEHFNSSFLSLCGNWANYLNIGLWTYAGGTSLAWVGDIGAGVCKSGMHGQARAIDISRITYANGVFIDANWSWRQPNLVDRRRYLALAASLRYWFATVITFGYTPDLSHENHIHADNGVAMQPLNTGWMTDALIVQMASNYLNYTSLAYGNWNSATESAYQNLLVKFNMTCYNPKTNLQHARFFWDLIFAHGIANQPAGTYKLSC